MPSPSLPSVADVDPGARLTGAVELAGDVFIGPGCTLVGPLQIGPGCRLVGHVWLQGPLHVGANNLFYPGVSVGFGPQILGRPHDAPSAGVVMGAGNVLREGVTIHGASQEQTPTRVGQGNYFMVNSHVGHDCWVGDACVLANGTLLGGHARVFDRVVTGGNSAVHQHCQVGRGALLSGAAAISRDLPPFCTATGINIVGSLNLVGMRRSGMTQEDIATVRWIYRTLYRQGLAPATSRRRLAERAGQPLVAEFLAFIAQSRRGLCRGAADGRRSK
jgi:UDP-N-acetylglucosamine acyltransferase